MNYLVTTYRIIRGARLLRPMLDIALLIATVGLFLHFQSLSQEHQRTPSFNQTAQKKNTQAPMAYIEQIHDSEVAMWQSFSSWFHNSNSNTGSCRFESQPTADSQNFHMLCIGNSIKESGKEQTLPAGLELPLSHVFATGQASKKPAAKRSLSHSKNDTKPEAPIVVQGWVETSRGRLHYDTVKQKWAK